MNLTLNHLSVGYGRRAVLADINADLQPVALTMLLGPNGAGKSTLLRTIIGVQPPVAGSITIDGVDIAQLPAIERARLISVVLTARTGGGGLTVNELVAIGRHPHCGVFGRLSASDRQIIADAIHAVGLDHKTHSPMASLSDGERQKALIARALAQQTPIIILDEPTSFLDIAARFDIIELLAKMVSERQTTILMSIHDITSSLPYSTHIWAIAQSQLHTGPTPEVIASGLLSTLFPNTAFNPATLTFHRG